MDKVTFNGVEVPVVGTVDSKTGQVTFYDEYKKEFEETKQ